MPKPTPFCDALDAALAQRARALDTDTAEALLDESPRPIDARFDPGPLPEPKRAPQPVIQDGQRLAGELRVLCRLIAAGDWTLLRLQAGHYATTADEAANALAEFGAV